TTWPRHEIDAPRDPRPPLPPAVHRGPFNPDHGGGTRPGRRPHDLRSRRHGSGDDPAPRRPHDRDCGGPGDPRGSGRRIATRFARGARGAPSAPTLVGPVAARRDLLGERLWTLRCVPRWPHGAPTRAERLVLPRMQPVSGVAQTTTAERPRATAAVDGTRKLAG